MSCIFSVGMKRVVLEERYEADEDDVWMPSPRRTRSDSEVWGRSVRIYSSDTTAGRRTTRDVWAAAKENMTPMREERRSKRSRVA